MGEIRAKDVNCITVSLVSCASVPANFDPPSPTSKIGVYLLVDDHPKHEHAGTTIFQNKEVKASLSTDFKKKYYEQIAELFGAMLVAISSTDQSKIGDRNGSFTL